MRQLESKLPPFVWTSGKLKEMIEDFGTQAETCFLQKNWSLKKQNERCMNTYYKFRNQYPHAAFAYIVIMTFLHFITSFQIKYWFNSHTETVKHITTVDFMIIFLSYQLEVFTLKSDPYFYYLFICQRVMLQVRKMDMCSYLVRMRWKMWLVSIKNDFLLNAAQWQNK